MVEQPRLDVLAVARSEVARMRAAVASVGEDDPEVRMRASQFAKLADLLQALVNCVPQPDEESLSDPRYWVPLDHFQKIKAEADHWEAEHSRLKEHTTFNEILRF